MARVVIVLGAGPNVGTKVAEQFTSAGYKVAVVSRSGKNVSETTAALSIAADLVHPEKVHHIFEEVREKLGEPSVVVYNSAAGFPLPPADDPFALDLKAFEDHFAINTTSAFAAAKEAVTSFKAISDSSIPKSFIYTGNFLNTTAANPYLTLGLGKAASAHFIEIGSQAYSPKGYGFYFADERTAEGKPVIMGVNGDAHAEHYFKLATEKTPVGWHQTFVKGQGYVKF